MGDELLGVLSPGRPKAIEQDGIFSRRLGVPSGRDQVLDAEIEVLVRRRDGARVGGCRRARLDSPRFRRFVRVLQIQQYDDQAGEERGEGEHRGEDQESLRRAHGVDSSRDCNQD